MNMSRDPPRGAFNIKNRVLILGVVPRKVPPAEADEHPYRLTLRLIPDGKGSDIWTEFRCDAVLG
jgi:hypothetical protein